MFVPSIYIPAPFNLLTSAVFSFLAFTLFLVLEMTGHSLRITKAIFWVSESNLMPLTLGIRHLGRPCAASYTISPVLVAYSLLSIWCKFTLGSVLSLISFTNPHPVLRVLHLDRPQLYDITSNAVTSVMMTVLHLVTMIHVAAKHWCWPLVGPYIQPALTLLAFLWKDVHTPNASDVGATVARWHGQVRVVDRDRHGDELYHHGVVDVGHVRRGLFGHLVHLVDDEPSSHAVVDGSLVEVAHNVVRQGNRRPRGKLLHIVVRHAALVVDLVRDHKPVLEDVADHRAMRLPGVLPEYVAGPGRP